ncbi:MAG: hypothetical protein Q7S29_04090 [Candidatus Peribacter sp.]|nr:hypothetical protein [Candidatus Peribacter sp.]
MSIADVELGLPPMPPMPFPEQMEVRYGVPMTVQDRIRFEIFLLVGHAGVMMDYSCRSQADFELRREGPRTINAFIRQVDDVLQSAHCEQEYGSPIPQEVRDAVGMYLFSLDDGVSRDIDFRQGPVSICGRTICAPAWRRSA